MKNESGVLGVGSDTKNLSGGLRGSEIWIGETSLGKRFHYSGKERDRGLVLKGEVVPPTMSLSPVRTRSPPYPTSGSRTGNQGHKDTSRTVTFQRGGS